MALAPEDPRMQELLHSAAAEVLRRVVERLGGADVPVLPVKGIVTAAILYDEPWQRPISDIDVRVPPPALARVRDVGRAAGWKELAWAPTYSNVVFEVAGIMVDVEGTVGPPGLCNLKVAEMLARASKGSVGHLVPELHDHAVLLCVNAFKDKLVRAAPWAIEDLARIVRHVAFDEGRFVQRCIDADVVALSWFVADWMATTRDDEHWLGLRDRLHRRRPRPLYLHALRAAIDLAPESFPTRVLARAASDDAWTRCLALATLLKFGLRSE